MKSDIIYSASKTVSCDGSGEIKKNSHKVHQHHDTGHPVVYLSLQKDHVVVCPYCDKKYQLKIESC